MVKFFEGEKTQPWLMPVHQIESDQGNSAQFKSEIKKVSESLQEQKFNVSLPVVCLTEEEDKYQLLTGLPILEAAKLAELPRMWVFLIAETKPNALKMIGDFTLQSKLNQALPDQQDIQKFIDFLNRSTESELIKRISGVGKQYAKLIHSQRPFQSQEDLKKLGPKRSLQWLQAYGQSGNN
jgi:hypothetical protein